MYLISKRGKYYRKIRLDLWGYYGMYFNIQNSDNKRMDRTIIYLGRVKGLQWKFTQYMRGKYIFRLWNKLRYLRSFYLLLKKKTFIKYIRMAMKGKLVRSFVSTYLGYLETRLFLIIYLLLNSKFI